MVRRGGRVFAALGASVVFGAFGCGSEVAPQPSVDAAQAEPAEDVASSDVAGDAPDEAPEAAASDGAAPDGAASDGAAPDGAAASADATLGSAAPDAGATADAAPAAIADAAEPRDAAWVDGSASPVDAATAPAASDATASVPDAGSLSDAGQGDAATATASEGGPSGPGSGLLAFCAGNGCADGTVECQGECVAADASCAFCAPGWTLCSVLTPSEPQLPPAFGTCTSLATDVNHCGDCNTVCSSGEICLAGACVNASTPVIVSGLQSPNSIAVDGTQVYWTDEGTGEVESAPKAGGPITVLAENQNQPSVLTLHGGFVYWAAAGSADAGTSAAILRAPIDASAPAAIIASTTINVAGTPFTFVGDTMYFVDDAAGISAISAGGAQSVVVDAKTDMTGDRYLSVATDGSSLFFLMDPSEVISPWVLYLSVPTPDEIANAQPTLLGQLGSNAFGTTVSGNSFFALTTIGYESYDVIDGMNGSGGQGNTREILAASCGLFAAQDGEAFVRGLAGYAPLTIAFYALNGTYPLAVFESLSTPEPTTAQALAVDDTFLYWADSTGAIERIRLP
jgi:hypothetical protein